MSINQQILFFFSGLGAFNGLLLCIYFLFFREPKHRANTYLGLLLLMLSIRIGKSTFLFFNSNLSKSFLQFGLTACFLIGPSLYMYVRSRVNKDQSKIPQYIISLLLIAFLVFGYFYSYESEPQLWRSTIVRGIYYEWLIFILAAGYLIKHQLKKILYRSVKLSKENFLMVNVFIGVFLIWLAYFTSSYTSYIVGAVSFSFIMYLSIFTIYIKNKKTPPVSKENKKVKYANKKIPGGEAINLLSRIENLMINEKVYTDSTLNLNKLASKLNIRTHLLSQLLNDNLEKSFSTFINEYRIEEAKQMLRTNDNLKIQAIAEICGFNSNSTFYTAFKKVTGTTPAEFIKNN